MPIEAIMKPKIDKTKFGSITVSGKNYDNDILIRLDGTVEKRKKKLSKEIFGTSHTISLAEAEYVYENGVEQLIIGAGQQGMVKLSDEASAFLQEKHCAVEIFPTPEAIIHWNEAKGATI